MPLISSKQMLLDAQNGGYAIGAFNIENMEMAQAVVSAAEELSKPIIIQTTPSTIKYGSPALFYGIVAALANNANVPIALHLDHGNSFDLVQSAVDAGYTSVMIDGSTLSFEENIKLTSSVTAVALPKEIPVEGELGTVGGKEDNMDFGASNYTDPDKAKEFVNRTGVSSLAIAIGTAHGEYKEVPRLDIERLIQIRKVVEAPLVLHGASGIDDEQIRQCIKEGICKINFATELRRAFSDGVQAYLAKDPTALDPKKYNTTGREYVKQLVIEKIKLISQ